MISKLKKLILNLVWISCVFQGAWAHVSLTFPPARQFPLDFLNTFWTKQPCGMPKGNIKTSLVAGQSFNATWHLGYAHQGGYRIELLDSRENRLMDLTPNNHNEFYQGRTTSQWHVINLPENATCQGCTIRLLRQVPEFAPNFQFISCSDVDIVNRQNYVETCNSHGYANGGKCTCYARYWGDRCQYQDECDTDLDCNGNGKCIYLGGSSLPRKQCFCSRDRFGTNCNRHNPSSMAKSENSLDLTKHVKVKLEERMTMFFKVLLGSSQSQDEIEFVVRINGTSYGGIGWRPSALGPICKSWPFYPDALYPTTRLQGRRVSKRSSTFTITKSVDQTEYGQSIPRGRKASSEVSPQQSIRNQFDFEQQPQAEVVSVTQSHSSSQGGSNSGSQSGVSYSQVQPIQQNIPVQEIRNVQKDVPSSGGSGSVDHELNQEPSFTPSEWAAKDPFTPMDCSDIIMGAARGTYHRIRDAYARGRHTPLQDYLWGGKDDLIGASGWEQNGVTTLVFRRRMDSTDGPDHPIRGDMLVIWARGQQPGESVSPHHQLEPGNSIISDFYTADEYKYHGLGPQRGLVYIDFTAVRKEYASGTFS